MGGVGGGERTIFCFVFIVLLKAEIRFEREVIMPSGH